MTTKKQSKGIASWPKSDRPRERLLQQGPQSLTEAELVAILLRVGYQGTNAVELGRQVIKRFGSLRAMMESPLSALQEIKGLKGAKAAQLSAALEIARRAQLPDSREKVRLCKSDSVVDYLTARLHGLPDEHFRGLYLNRQNMLLEDVLFATGTVDQVRPAIRNIVAKALHVNASALILGHNHPSGSAGASESDRMFTADVLAALRPIGVTLLDHIIVAGDSAFSFADAGLMAELNLECLAPQSK
ncbi:MAG: DNA repair protein RadC [Desulfatirhabdiaceae bacterium]